MGDLFKPYGDAVLLIGPDGSVELIRLRYAGHDILTPQHKDRYIVLPAHTSKVSQAQHVGVIESDPCTGSF